MGEVLPRRPRGAVILPHLSPLTFGEVWPPALPSRLGQSLALDGVDGPGSRHKESEIQRDLVAVGPGDADQYRTRRHRSRWLHVIAHFSLQKPAFAGAADPSATAEVGGEPMGFGKLEQGGGLAFL